ncbi:MAG: hypothetical protein CVU42_11750 [Chloroflexi bacterium HGW-Chloroflexi-4]|jgi:hypothetical protein|nr:MAG: hypothetical protein CVU42_11750 [Chloroflexi bacterium HGW-Chloroflexi-4]
MLHKEIARRDLLKLGLVAGGAVLFSGCQKAVNMDLSTSQLRVSDPSNSKMEELIRYATLAANGHNTQPWKFRIMDKTLEIHPDLSRRLNVVDPQDRELWISLGCALENLVIAAGAAGFANEIIYPAKEQNYIKINLQSDTTEVSHLFNSIQIRQSTRSEYNHEKLSNVLMDQIHSVSTEPGVSLKFIENISETERVIEYLNAGNMKQYADKAFLEELIFWLRFNQKEALSTMDGLFSKCSGNPTVPRFLGEMFVSSTKPQKQAEADAKKLLSSSGSVVFATDNDTPESWVRCGQVFERLSLHLTSLDLKSALVNQPIEVPELRGEFQTAMGLGSNLPQLLMRFGVADAMPYSLRRPVEEVLI